MNLVMYENHKTSHDLLIVKNFLIEIEWSKNGCVLAHIDLHTRAVFGS